MLYFTKKKGDCTGCSACMAVCPVQCIKMQKDEEGFLYPVASDACIHCGKCQRVCPIENNSSDESLALKQMAYCALSKDKKTWQRSASGGAFTEICRAFGDTETIICGAAWDGLNVHHVCVQGVDNIDPLCKSKYVASSPENVFSEIKNHLQNGKKVIFCGTPCQVAGLNAMLDKPYENLLTIDLICHGVGSPDVFQTSMEVIGEQFHQTVIGYEFRTKKNTHIQDYLQKINTQDGNVLFLKDDPYINLFLSQKCLRPSCGDNCHFRSASRPGDVTIADFKGLLEVFPDLKGTKWNYSSIITNSPKGAKVVQKLTRTMQMRACDLEVIKQYNPLFYRQTWASEERDVFFSDFIASPKEAIRKWTKPAKVYTESNKRKLWEALPTWLRKLVLNRRSH